MRGSDFLETVERGDHAGIGAHATGEVAAEYGLETHAVQVGRRLHVAAGAELGETIIDRLTVVGDAFVAALREQRRLARPEPSRGAEAEESELERSRAEVGDEDVHDAVRGAHGTHGSHGRGRAGRIGP